MDSFERGLVTCLVGFFMVAGALVLYLADRWDILLFCAAGIFFLAALIEAPAGSKFNFGSLLLAIICLIWGGLLYSGRNNEDIDPEMENMDTIKEIEEQTGQGGYLEWAPEYLQEKGE